MSTPLCADCATRNPYLIILDGRLVCEHRRACEARQMLARGESAAKAAAHAQNPKGP